MSDIATWMQTFVTVADKGNFSAAARTLALSQSALSKHVAALEGHLRTRLFNRTTRSLSLTTDGARFYEAARSALEAIEIAQHSVAQGHEMAGIIRMTAPLTLAESRIIPMLTDFLASNPRIEIDFSASDHALNLITDSLDLAIRVGAPADNRLVARRMGLARRVMVAAPAYLDRAGRPRTPGDLTSHSCLAYSLHSAGAKWHFEGGTSVEINGNFRADSPNALRTAALAGLGIALNARWLFENDIAAGALEIVLADTVPVAMPIHVVLPPGRFVAARTRALIDFLSDRFAQDPLLAEG